jgi:hypothetical protein
MTVFLPALSAMNGLGRRGGGAPVADDGRSHQVRRWNREGGVGMGRGIIRGGGIGSGTEPFGGGGGRRWRGNGGGSSGETLNKSVNS